MILISNTVYHFVCVFPLFFFEKSSSTFLAYLCLMAALASTLPKQADGYGLFETSGLCHKAFKIEMQAQ